MLKHRIFTSLSLLLVVYVIFFGIPGLFYVPEWIFISCVWLLCLTCIYELTRMYKFGFLSQVGLMILISTILFLLYSLPYDSSQIVRIISVITWCLIAPLILLYKPEKFSKIAIIGLSVLIFVPAFYAIVVLHGLFGSWQLISILAIAWVSDTGAYFVGRRFGRHKLSPQISPGKSIEGAIGGMFFVIIYLLILKELDWSIYLTSYLIVFKFGVILTVVSIIGDLLESWFKRVSGVKDSGSILPGHGGVLDRLDSLLAVLAVSFAMIRGII